MKRRALLGGLTALNSNFTLKLRSNESLCTFASGMYYDVGVTNATIGLNFNSVPDYIPPTTLPVLGADLFYFTEVYRLVGNPTVVSGEMKYLRIRSISYWCDGSEITIGLYFGYNLTSLVFTFTTTAPIDGSIAELLDKTDSDLSYNTEWPAYYSLETRITDNDQLLLLYTLFDTFHVQDEVVLVDEEVKVYIDNSRVQMIINVDSSGVRMIGAATERGWLYRFNESLNLFELVDPDVPTKYVSVDAGHYIPYEEGMTWQEWCASEYNIYGWTFERPPGRSYACVVLDKCYETSWSYVPSWNANDASNFYIKTCYSDPVVYGCGEE